MDRVITLLCALALAAGGMAAWDRHAPWAVTIPYPRPALAWPPIALARLRIGLPPSLAEQLDQARAERDQARAATLRCGLSLRALDQARAAQNAAVEQLRADSEARAAALAAGLKRAEGARRKAESQAAQLLAFRPPAGDVCSRLEAVDRLVQEQAR